MSELQIFKAITPKRAGLLNVDILNQKTNAVLRSYESKAKELLKKPTRSWTHKPQFSVTRIVGSKEIRIIVYPSGENAFKYRIINNGSRARVIRAKGNGRMTFKVGYRASTVPNTLSSRTARRSGRVVSVKTVGAGNKDSKPHKITARRFTRTAAIELRKTFSKDVSAAIRAAVKASR